MEPAAATMEASSTEAGSAAGREASGHASMLKAAERAGMRARLVMHRRTRVEMRGRLVMRRRPRSRAPTMSLVGMAAIHWPAAGDGAASDGAAIGERSAVRDVRDVVVDDPWLMP